jgi:HPt (histidine-containing phosphotransfer) domain-containing protein
MRADLQCLVDRDYLETISGGDRDFERELFSVFVDTAGEMVHDITSAWLAQDPERLARAAHKLKGSAKSIGLTRLGQLCYSIEMAGRENEPDRVSAEMLAELKSLTQSVTDYLAEEYAQAA